MPREGMDQQVVNLVCEILAREEIVFDAITTLGCTIGAMSRVTQCLTPTQRVVLSEFLRDVGDELEHRRCERVKV